MKMGQRLGSFGLPFTSFPLFLQFGGVFHNKIKPTVDKEAMSVSYFGYSNINSTLWFICMMSFCLIWLCAVYLIFHAVNISPLFFDQIFSFNLYVLSHVP